MNASCMASAAVTSIARFSTTIASMSVIFTQESPYYRGRLQNLLARAAAGECMTDLSMKSDLRHSERLGRRIRTGDARSLGVPTEDVALGEMTSQESLELTIEGMRGHFTGPARAGRVGVAEEDDRWILSFDPCGSGGRMRRSDPDRAQTPRTEAPFSFAVTEEAHDWSWGRKGVCLYCAHCAVVNEIMPIERLGAPMRMTENPENPDDQCRWTIYKSPELVPDWVYERVGKQPP